MEPRFSKKQRPPQVRSRSPRCSSVCAVFCPFSFRQTLSVREACKGSWLTKLRHTDTTGSLSQWCKATVSGARSCRLSHVVNSGLRISASRGDARAVARRALTIEGAQLSPLMHSWHRTRPPSSQLRHLRKMTEEEKRCLCCADFLLPPQTGHGRYW